MSVIYLKFIIITYETWAYIGIYSTQAQNKPEMFAKASTSSYKKVLKH